MAVGENLLTMLVFYVIGRALGVQLSLVSFFAVIAVTSLVRRLAMYIEGRGLGEGSAIVMFTFLGVQKDAAVALTFAHYAVWLVGSLPGAYLLLRSGVSVRDVVRVAIVAARRSGRAATGFLASTTNRPLSCRIFCTAAIPNPSASNRGFRGEISLLIARESAALR